jgi:hypothetical protein
MLIAACFCATQTTFRACVHFLSYLTADNNTTVGVKSLSSNGRAVRRSQEDEASSDLRGLRGAANRAGELLLCLLVHGGGDQRSPDRTGSDSVDADAAADVLVVKTAGEGDDSTLCRCVVLGGYSQQG